MCFKSFYVILHCLYVPGICAEFCHCHSDMTITLLQSYFLHKTIMLCVLKDILSVPGYYDW